MHKTNDLLAMLSTSDLSALDQWTSIVQLTRGDVLAEPGDDIRKVYFLHSGIVSYLVALDDGSMIQTAMVGRDGVIGAAQAVDNKKSVNQIVVQISGSASVVDRDDLRWLLPEHATLRNTLAAHEQFFVADIQQTAACNARHSVEARMARWLLRMRDLVGDEFELTQDYLASMIGVRRSSVTTIAQTMQANGATSYSRGNMHVRDDAELERQSCECHKTVRENYEMIFGAPWPKRH